MSVVVRIGFPPRLSAATTGGENMTVSFTFLCHSLCLETTMAQVSVCDPGFCPGSEYTLVVQFEANPLPTQVVANMFKMMTGINLDIKIYELLIPW